MQSRSLPDGRGSVGGWFRTKETLSFAVTAGGLESVHRSLQDVKFRLCFQDESLQILDYVVGCVEFEVAAGGDQIESTHLNGAFLDGVRLRSDPDQVACQQRLTQHSKALAHILFEDGNQVFDDLPASTPHKLMKIFGQHPSGVDRVIHMSSLTGDLRSSNVIFS